MNLLNHNKNPKDYLEDQMLKYENELVDLEQKVEEYENIITNYMSDGKRKEAQELMKKKSNIIIRIKYVLSVLRDLTEHSPRKL